jgi:hypothetical protein
LSFQDVSMGIDPFRLVHSLELLIVGIISVVLEWTFVVVQKCQRIVVIHVTDIVNHGLELLFFIINHYSKKINN